MARASKVCVAFPVVPVVSVWLAVWLGGCERPPQDGQPPSVPPSPTPDPALAAFERAGIVPPRTVMTQATPGAVDPAWIREAIAAARPVDGRRLEAAVKARAPLAHRQALLSPQREADEGTASPQAAAPTLGARTHPDLAAPPLGLDELQGQVTVDMETASPISFASEASEDVGGDGGDSSPVATPRRLDGRVVSPPRLGKVLFQNAEGKYESLVPRALRVQAFIEGPRARTVVDYVFSNPHDRRLQGTFYYPLPAGASPAAFGMFRGTARIEDAAFAAGTLLPPVTAVPGEGEDEDAVLAALAPSRAGSASAASVKAALVRDWGELQVARVVEQKRAREVYEEVVRRDIDPALLEWSGANTFQAQVFPIEPRSVKRVVLVYDETLPADGELLRYTYPLPEARELGPIACRLAVAVEHGRLVSIGGQPPPAPGGGRAAKGAASRWAEHELALEPAPGAAIDAAIAPTSPGAETLEAASCRGLEGSVFFSRLRPPVPAREREGRTGRALFLVDTSLSSAEASDGLSTQLLEKVLATDATIEEYAVVLFDVRPRWLHAPFWRRNEPAVRAETMAELARVYLEGATCFDAVLAELENQRSWLLDPARPVHAFLLSDGFITWGQDRPEALLRSRPAASLVRWICYQLGNAPSNRDLFDALTRVSTGRTVTVLTRDELAAAAAAHRMASVVLAGVRVEGAAARDLTIAGEPRLLFPGQELQVAGRVPRPGDRVEIVVEAEADGRRETWKFPLRCRGDSLLAPRAWAELHARRLLALDDERLDRMVVALSQRFHLANRAASLLILEREADYQAFDLKAEEVDLERLEDLRTKEEDQRRDRLQGIALDGAPPEALEVVALLDREAERTKPTQPSQPLVDAPLAGGEPRAGAEVAYRQAREKDALDVQAYDAVARTRALAGDTAGAVRAYSCLVEKMPANAEAARLAGYACLALGQHLPAAELLERVRLQRPFEPQAYLEEALALESLGRWGKAARNFEIVLARPFPRHKHEGSVAAAVHYARLLRGRIREESLAGEAKALLQRRLAQVEKLAEGGAGQPVDLQLSIHWNTSSTDIDLWVEEPEGERCYYEHRETRSGGKLFWDITDGYGPEIYQRRSAKGTFEGLINYYGNNSARWSVPTVVLVIRDRGLFGAEDGFTRRYQLRLLGEAKAVLSVWKEDL